ncbi:hypothetical protein [Kitasatospora sp. NPDC004289]
MTDDLGWDEDRAGRHGIRGWAWFGATVLLAVSAAYAGLRASDTYSDVRWNRCLDIAAVPDWVWVLMVVAPLLTLVAAVLQARVAYLCWRQTVLVVLSTVTVLLTLLCLALLLLTGDDILTDVRLHHGCV